MWLEVSLLNTLWRDYLNDQSIELGLQKNLVISLQFVFGNFKFVSGQTFQMNLK